jgi:hypothetical protein
MRWAKVCNPGHTGSIRGLMSLHLAADSGDARFGTTADAGRAAANDALGMAMV